MLYDKLTDNSPWEYAQEEKDYLKIKNNKIQLPKEKYVYSHFNYIDKIIEVSNAFKKGVLPTQDADMSTFEVEIISNCDKAINTLNNLSSHYKLFSIDIESSNLLTDKEKNKLLCIGIAYDENKSIVILNDCFKDEYFKQFFQIFLNRSDLRFILHNGIFDKSRLKILEDLDIKIDEDTLLMHYCGINEHKGTHGLKDLAQLYLKFNDWEKPLDDWKRQYCRSNKIKLSDFEYDYFDINLLAQYCGYDVIATFRLYKTFKILMRDNSIAIYKKLIEASEYYSNMISRGMLLDTDYWYKLRDDLENENKKLEDELNVFAPGVKITSPLQLKKCLSEMFPNCYIDSTDRETIENLLLKYPNNEFLIKLLDYRKNVKYLKTYVYGLWERKDSSNIIHCEFKLHGTETGRLSSANPNMQNIPRNSSIKKLFIARPGYVLLQLDYSQAELRVLAYISNDKNLIQCYVDGRDLHTEIQKRLFKDKYDEHNKDQRVIAKTINFGIPYGRTANGMASKLRISMSEAKTYLNDWFANAPDVKIYIERCHKMAKSDPQDVYYTVFGRARHYIVTEENVGHIENQAVNFPISSTANDLTIYSLVEIGKYIKEHNLDAYLVNTVHDSIIIEVTPKQAKHLSEVCQKIMSDIPKKYLPNVTLPFRADAEIGYSYGDMKEPDWEEYELDL